MGQKIEFNSEDWDFLDENELAVLKSEICLPNDFFKGEHDTASLDSPLFDNQSLDPEVKITAYINGEEVSLMHQSSDHLPSSQQEVAFRRQIEDLFELLEMEKESSKTNGVRVYQTDSSPSRPWRFH